MKKVTVTLLSFVSICLLTGCSEKMIELKEAVSGIDSVVNKAAKSISLNALSIREIEIDYNDNVFTLNDLCTTILRDVQWEYEEKEDIHILTVKGT